MPRPWLALLFCVLLSTHIPRVLSDDDVEDEDYVDQDRALLIIRKAVKEDSAVQGRNLTVSVSIFNAGASSALSVDLQDAALPEVFSLVSGSLSAKFERIPVGANVTHEYVVVATSAEGTVVLNPATVKYQPDMESEEFQVGRSGIAAVYILTASQQIQKHLLTTGAYITLGLCKSPTDWRNFAVVIAVLTVVLGGNWGYKKVTSAKQKWNREKHLKDFGYSEDEVTKKSSRKTRRAAEEKEN